MIRRERFILACVNRVRGLHSREKLHDCAEGHPTRTSGSPHGQQTRDVVASRTDANERTVCDSDAACSGRENRKEVRAARAGNFGPSASQERSGLSSGGPNSLKDQALTRPCFVRGLYRSQLRGNCYGGNRMLRASIMSVAWVTLVVP